MKVHNLLVTGSLTSGGENIGSISSSVATTNNTQDNRISSLEVTTGSLNTHTSSVITRLNSIETTTGSLNTFTSSASSRLNSIENVTGSYATTGSNQFKNDQVITGSLTVTGFIDAQELRTTYISSSILYRSGSTKFGDELTDNHAFTGSMLISGSVTTSSSVTAGGAISTSGTGLNASVRINNTTVSTGVDWHLYSLNNGNFGLYNNTSGAYALQISSTGISTFSSTGGSGLRVYGGSGTNQWDIYLNSTNLRFSDNTGTGNIVFDRPLNGTSATFSGNLNLQGAVTRNINFYDSSDTNINAQIQYDQISSTSGQLFFGTNNAGTFATRLTISNTGAATFSSTVTATKGFFSSNGASDSTTGLLANASTNDSTTYAAIFGSLNAGYRMVVRADGNVGIGTTNPEALLHLSQASTGGNGAFIFIDNPASSTLGNTAGIRFATNAGASFSGYGSFIQAVNTNAGNGAEALTFGTWDGSSRDERMRITSGGNIELGKSLNTTLTVENNGTYSGGSGAGSTIRLNYGGQTIARISNTGTGQRDAILQLSDEGTVKVNIAANSSRGDNTYFNNGGNVGIGLTTPQAILDVSHTAGTTNIIRVSNGSGNYRWRVDQVFSMIMTNASGTDTFSVTTAGAGTFASNVTTSGNIELTSGANRQVTIGSATNYNYRLKTDGDDFAISEAGNTDRLRYSYTNVRWTITGGLTISGSLSKGSGSFRIDHPLPSKKDTHKLVHSFIEGPQADNIYRGKIVLVNGGATINLDSAARMTEGTFVLLNGNIQCFTSNESGWTAIRGNVEGNILTIEAQDSECTDTISWLVIGERIDQHMIDTDWTDENGRVIVEPLITEV